MVRVVAHHALTGESAFAQKVQADAARKLNRVMKQMQDEVVVEVQSIIREEFVIDRDPSRRKKGTRRLINSIQCDLDSDGKTFPVSLRVYAIGDQGKIGALERGAPMHDIPIVPKSGKGKDFLFFPRTRVVHKTKTESGTVRYVGAPREGRVGVYGKQGRAGTGRDVVKGVQFTHPGNQKPRRFMERGLRRVIERHLGGARP